MEASNTETHEAFSRLALASGPPPIRRLAERTISGAFVKFDKVLLLFVCLESSLLFCLFFCFLSLSFVFNSILSGGINHGAVPLSHLSRQKLHSHYVNSLPTISHKEGGLRVMCGMPAGVDQR